MNPFYRTVRTVFRPLLRVYNRMEVLGLEHVPESGPCIVVANHHSYLDAFVLGAAFPRKIRFMVKHSQYTKRGTGWFYWGMDAFPVNQNGRDMDAIREAMRTLEAGLTLGVFPAGSRAWGPEPAEWASGFAMLARRTALPVVPAALQGTFEAHPRGSKIPRPAKVRVVFGEACRFEHGRGKAGLEAFSCEMQERVAGMLTTGEPNLLEAAASRAERG